MTLPDKIRALKMVSQGVAEVKETSLPTIGENQVLVKAKAFGLNPTDWKHIDLLPTPDSTVGCDGAGEIVAVGSAVTRFKVGDRATFLTHGCSVLDKDAGCFAEYFRAYEHVGVKLPEHISDEEGATISVAVNTVGALFYLPNQLPDPSKPAETPFPVLIWGAATSTGLVAVQLAKLSNFKVIATCSPKNFDLIKSLGADVVIDYNEPDAVQKIKEATDNKLKYAFDCHSDDFTLRKCHDSICAEGGSVSYTVPAVDVSWFSPNIKAFTNLAYSCLGQDFMFITGMFKFSPEVPKYARYFADIASKLLEEKKLKPLPMKIVPGGLSGIVPALFEIMKPGHVSAVKLVARVEDEK